MYMQIMNFKKLLFKMFFYENKNNVRNKDIKLLVMK